MSTEQDTKPPIAYVVTRGSYSDYRILGVFTDPELAERFCVLEQGDEVEEFPLNVALDCPPGFLPWNVLMTHTCDCRVYRTDLETLRAQQKQHLEWYPYGNMRDVVFPVLAKNQTHAVKIANEKRAQLIASGEWTTDSVVFNRRRQAAQQAAQATS